MATMMQNEIGRPTKYKPEFCETAYRLCLLRAKDTELADFLGIAESTIYEWKKEYPEFSEAITRGKIVADANVAKSLYDRAIGATYYEEQAFKLKKGKDLEVIEVVKLEKQAPPDTQAASLWLRNRRSADWNDKSEVPTININVHKAEQEVRALSADKRAMLREIIEGECEELE